MLTWISHGCTCVSPHPENLSYLPPHPIALGCPRAPTLRALLHVPNLHWLSVLDTVIYTFQHCSLILSHPCLLSHSPKVHSLHLCLFCCLACRIIVIVFLNSIYMHSIWNLKRWSPYMQNRKRDTDVQNTLLDSVGEGEGGMFWENSIETSILSRVKQIPSPGWMHETSAQGWCTGKTQRDGMEREAGGGIGMGNTCKSMTDSCQSMAKTTTIL